MTRTLLLLTLALAPTAFAGDGDAVLAAIALPAKATALREAGVPADDVRDALKSGKDHGVKCGEMGDVLDEARRDTETHGRVDRFGAFVQAQLAAGKRGPELAAAIRAEHEARGIGHHGKGGDHGKPHQDRGDDHGSGDHGKGDDHGSGGHGKGDDHGSGGRPDGKGPGAHGGGPKAAPEGGGRPEGPRDGSGGAPTAPKGPPTDKPKPR